VVGSAGEHPFKTGTRWPIDNPAGSTTILQTAEPIRIEYTDDRPRRVAAAARKGGLRWAIGVPINVEGQVWGSIGVAAGGGGELPPEAESRLTGFTQLVATAISNATNYSQLLASRARIVAAADEARRRIERNLHDGTQQADSSRSG
jgi:GAF domain-containing protein